MFIGLHHQTWINEYQQAVNLSILRNFKPIQVRLDTSIKNNYSTDTWVNAYVKEKRIVGCQDWKTLEEFHI